MKAALTVYIAGEPDRHPGDIVEGNEAARLCAAGYATPIVEAPAKPEKAVKKAPAKETREEK